MVREHILYSTRKLEVVVLVDVLAMIEQIVRRLCSSQSENTFYCQQHTHCICVFQVSGCRV